jgi:hypothetical protein
MWRAKYLGLREGTLLESNYYGTVAAYLQHRNIIMAQDKNLRVEC